MFRFLLPLIFLTNMASSQDAATGPAIAQEKVAQWVLTKKTIAEEGANWAEQKQMLTDLIALREREVDQMDEVINLAKERVTDIEKKTADLKSEEQSRKAWRKNFEIRVTTIEDSLIQQLPFFPAPITNKLYDSIERLKDRDDNGELQSRFRDVLAILNECNAFNSQIHTMPEIHEIDGQKVEVDVIYLGMKQAWYVDRTNKKAATGIPTSQGWRWSENADIAGKVRRAIDIQTKSQPPAFVKLPLENQKGDFE